MSEHLQAIATLFSLVNPAVCAMIFANIIQGQSRASALRSATFAVAIVAVVLTIAAFLGARILDIFGISLDAFSVAGGAVLIFIGFAMLQGSTTPSTPAAAGGDGAQLGSLVLFAASPGTITGVMTIVSAHHRDHGIPVTAIVGIALVLAVTWAMLVATAWRSKPDSQRPSLAREMMSRYMGLIIIAMGIQFALTGYKAFMG